MEIREYTTYREEEILPLYAAVGWTAYTDQPSVLARGFANSLLTLGAYEDEKLIGLVRTVGDGCTVVLVTHSLTQARRMADEVLFLREGRLEERGSAREVLSHPRSPETRAFLDFYAL